jgi:hypothetical protein
MKPDHDHRSESASTELDRLRHDGETIGGRAMPDAPADPNDAAERWGGRIGRTLGWLAAAFLLYQLVMAYSS